MTATHSSNGVIRIKRKGTAKFAFGEDGEPFEVDVVTAFQEWISIDEQFRIEEGLPNEGTIPTERMLEFRRAGVEFAQRCTGYDPTSTETYRDPKSPAIQSITSAEAFDFIARLRECYDDCAAFFQPKSREERGMLGTSGAASSDTSKTELRFSTEAP